LNQRSILCLDRFDSEILFRIQTALATWPPPKIVIWTAEKSFKHCCIFFFWLCEMYRLSCIHVELVDVAVILTCKCLLDGQFRIGGTEEAVQGRVSRRWRILTLIGMKIQIQNNKA
jgi:hypothetical protein